MKPKTIEQKESTKLYSKQYYQTHKILILRKQALKNAFKRIAQLKKKEEDKITFDKLAIYKKNYRIKNYEHLNNGTKSNTKKIKELQKDLEFRKISFEVSF